MAEVTVCEADTHAVGGSPELLLFHSLPVTGSGSANWIDELLGELLVRISGMIKLQSTRSLFMKRPRKFHRRQLGLC